MTETTNQPVVDEPRDETVETRRDENERSQLRMHDLDDRDEAALNWLEEEFPEWHFEVGVATTGTREDLALWIARQEGHHPQSELSAGKLHSRLSGYLERQRARHPESQDSN